MMPTRSCRRTKDLISEFQSGAGLSPSIMSRTHGKVASRCYDAAPSPFLGLYVISEVQVITAPVLFGRSPMRHFQQEDEACHESAAF